MAISFKPYYQGASLIGEGTIKFKEYAANKSTTERWVINETFDKFTTSADVQVDFVSGGSRFGMMSIGGSSSKYYGLIYSYKRSDGIWQTFFPLQNGWTVDKYRTIIFDKPVTDSTLLSWLQKNAVKQ